MKTSIFLLANLLCLSFFANTSFAGDVYAEYKMTGMGNKPIITKIYSKNGDLRTEADVEMGNRKMTTNSLMFKSKPDITLVFNAMNKTYTEVKNTNSASSVKDFDVKVIGNEKIGNYNCTHVKMSSNGQSWDMWYAKDLPSISFPVSGQNSASSKKMLALLKSKGITGMPVKISIVKPGSSTGMTMLLTKYEQKTLSAALFTIPAGYKKSSVSFDAEKMKNMTPQQKKEMIMKMMKEQGKQ
ncbi:MAG: DUF4412 domain-containing protein [Pedobacter sp.]|nr:MAG: DUF4412 domain-containing protein [Pedobacter sp.]